MFDHSYYNYNTLDEIGLMKSCKVCVTKYLDSLMKLHVAKSICMDSDH